MARLAEVLWDLGRLEDGLEHMNQSFELLSQDEPDADLASLAAQLGRFLFFGGQSDLGAQRIEAALEMAENLVLPEVLVQALTTKAVILNSSGRRQEALALLRYSVRTAAEHDKPSAGLRAMYNLADQLAQFDRYDEAVAAVRDGLAQTRRVGNRYWELSFLGQLYAFVASGAWDEALAMCGELPIDEWEQVRAAFSGSPVVHATVGVHRGTAEEARRVVARFQAMETSADLQEQSAYQCANARLLLAEGDARQALAVAEQAFAEHANLGFAAETVKEAIVVAGEAALELGDRDRLEELLAQIDALPLGQRSAFLRAHVARFRARLASGDESCGRRAVVRRGGRRCSARSGWCSTWPSSSSSSPSSSRPPAGSTSASRSPPRHARSSKGSARFPGSSVSTRSPSASSRPPEARLRSQPTAGNPGVSSTRPSARIVIAS